MAFSVCNVVSHDNKKIHLTSISALRAEKESAENFQCAKEHMEMRFKARNFFFSIGFNVFLHYKEISNRGTCLPSETRQNPIESSSEAKDGKKM